jgi:hypothetical protein
LASDSAPTLLSALWLEHLAAAEEANNGLKGLPQVALHIAA